MTGPTRVLLVANRTAVGEALLHAVEERARRGPSTFHLVVPATPMGLHRLVDPEVAGHQEAKRQLWTALEMLEASSGESVSGEVGDADPLAAIQDAIGRSDFDEIVISTLPRRMSRWLRLDLVSKARGLGVPVSHVQSAPLGDDEPGERVTVPA